MIFKWLKKRKESKQREIHKKANEHIVDILKQNGIDVKVINTIQDWQEYQMEAIEKERSQLSDEELN